MQEFHHNTVKGMLWINNWTWFQWLQVVIPKQTKKDPTNPHYDAVLFGICILREFNISFMYNSTSICIQMCWWQKYEWFASCSDSYMVLRRQGELQILLIHSADLNLQASTKILPTNYSTIAITNVVMYMAVEDIHYKHQSISSDSLMLWNKLITLLWDILCQYHLTSLHQNPRRWFNV